MGDWATKFTSAGAGTGVLSALFFWSMSSNWSAGNIFTALFFCGFPFICNVLLTLVLFHIASLQPAASHSFASLITAYLGSFVILPIVGKKAHSKTLSMTEDPQRYQDETLMDIIEANRDTAFGEDHHFESIKDRSDFTANFPLTTFSHYEDYVERVANGEQNVMTGYEVTHLCTSSGTTGKNKMYPLTNADAKLVKNFIFCGGTIISALQGKALDRHLCFALNVPVRKSKGNIPMGTLGSAKKQVNPSNVIPELNSFINQEEPSYFVQAVFGLRDPDIGYFQNFSSDLTHAFFTFFENNKTELHKAIATGHIEAMPGLDEDIRNKLNQLLTPEPERADDVLRELLKGPERLALRLWPKLKYAVVCRGGGFAHTASILEKSYLKDVKFSMGAHFGTEGFYGQSLTIEDALNEAFTLVPYLVFLEFIKVEDMEKENPKVYLLNELVVGQLYELVVTNFHGLYRNRFGDVIKVVGFTNQTPKYVFQYRTGQILNCGLDRTPESVFYDALQKTEKEWKMQVNCYTTVENVHLDEIRGIKSPKNHYVVFLDVSGEGILAQEHQEMLEANLCSTQESYGQFRDLGSIGPVEMIQVCHGTFDGLRGILYGGQQNSQFKMPRVLRKPAALDYLWSKRLTK